MKNNIIFAACAFVLILLGGILIAKTPRSESDLPVSADRTVHSWYIMPQGEGKQPVVADDAPFKDDYPILYLGSPEEKKVWLTFDLGYENGNTAKTLNALKQERVEAAFFVCGNVIDRNPELIRRMADEGHTVCNHTDKHADLTTLDKEGIRKELTALEEKYTALTGKTMSKLMRPPEGKYSEATLADLKALGYTPVFWSFAYKDWVDGEQPKPADALATISSRTHPGMVMLLHSTSATNAEIMVDLIRQLRAQGYTIAPISELERR